jgi:hypothetical protein
MARLALVYARIFALTFLNENKALQKVNKQQI